MALFEYRLRKSQYAVERRAVETWALSMSDADWLPSSESLQRLGEAALPPVQFSFLQSIGLDDIRTASALIKYMGYVTHRTGRLDAHLPSDCTQAVKQGARRRTFAAGTRNATCTARRMSGSRSAGSKLSQNAPKRVDPATGQIGRRERRRFSAR